MPSVDGSAAADTFVGFRSNIPAGCLFTVWKAYKANGARAAGTYPTALSAFYASDPGSAQKSKNPPRGALIWLGRRNHRTGLNDDAGDVFVSLGDGRCAATDYPGWGSIGVCTIDQRIAQTDRVYLGWTLNLLGNKIIIPTPADTGDPKPVPEPDPIYEEDEMPGKILLVKTNGAAPVEACIGDPAYGKDLAQYTGDAKAANVRRELGGGRYEFRGFIVVTTPADITAAISAYSRGDRKPHATRNGNDKTDRQRYIDAQVVLSLDAVLQG